MNRSPFLPLGTLMILSTAVQAQDPAIDAGAPVPSETTVEEWEERTGVSIEAEIDREEKERRHVHWYFFYPNPSLVWRPLKEKQLREYLPLLISELSLYPPEGIRKIGLRRIVLTRGLRRERSYGGNVDPIEGCSDDRDPATIYLNVPSRIDPEDRDKLARYLHHELFHRIDRQDDLGGIQFDPGWTRLNPDGFRYGDLRRREGTVSRYARTSRAEDKAEIFAHMIVNDGTLAALLAKDSVVAAKVDVMEKILLDVSPRFDEEFWSRVRAVRRAETPMSHSVPVLLGDLSEWNRRHQPRSSSLQWQNLLMQAGVGAAVGGYLWKCGGWFLSSRAEAPVWAGRMIFGGAAIAVIAKFGWMDLPRRIVNTCRNPGLPEVNVGLSERIRQREAVEREASSSRGVEPMLREIGGDSGSASE